MAAVLTALIAVLILGESALAHLTSIDTFYLDKCKAYQKRYMEVPYRCAPETANDVTVLKKCESAPNIKIDSVKISNGKSDGQSYCQVEINDSEKSEIRTHWESGAENVSQRFKYGGESYSMYDRKGGIVTCNYDPQKHDGFKKTPEQPFPWCGVTTDEIANQQSEPYMPIKQFPSPSDRMAVNNGTKLWDEEYQVSWRTKFFNKVKGTFKSLGGARGGDEDAGR